MVAIDSASPGGFGVGNEERALERELARFSNKVSRGGRDCVASSPPAVDPMVG